MAGNRHDHFPELSYSPRRNRPRPQMDPGRSAGEGNIGSVIHQNARPRGHRSHNPGQFAGAQGRVAYLNEIHAGPHWYQAIGDLVSNHFLSALGGV
ncbi:MAG: hypothetical protein M3N54_14285 [Acidobacteriota bacterium]|nr:hypothetical protein [Acidobacteriota bacterium]